VTVFGSILPAALLVAFLSLEQTAVGQFMVSQPLVGGWIMGAVFGRPLEGLAAGLLLQLLCLTEIRAGASIPPDFSYAGLLGAALCLVVPRPPGWSHTALMGLAVLIFLPVAHLGRSAEALVCRKNRMWTAAATARIKEGRPEAAQRAALGGVPFFFAKSFVLSIVILAPLAAWTGSLSAGAAALNGPFELLARLAPFAALGIVAAREGKRSSAAAAAFGFLAGVLMSWRLL